MSLSLQILWLSVVVIIGFTAMWYILVKILTELRKQTKLHWMKYTNKYMGNIKL